MFSPSQYKMLIDSFTDFNILFKPFGLFLGVEEKREKSTPQLESLYHDREDR